jgi:hypothetical protein
VLSQTYAVTDWTYIVVTPAVEIDEVYIGDSTAPLDGEFENYTDTTGNVLPTGWGCDTSMRTAEEFWRDARRNSYPAYIWLQPIQQKT